MFIQISTIARIKFADNSLNHTAPEIFQNADAAVAQSYLFQCLNQRAVVGARKPKGNIMPNGDPYEGYAMGLCPYPGYGPYLFGEDQVVSWETNYDLSILDNNNTTQILNFFLEENSSFVVGGDFSAFDSSGAADEGEAYDLGSGQCIGMEDTGDAFAYAQSLGVPMFNGNMGTGMHLSYLPGYGAVQSNTPVSEISGVIEGYTDPVEKAAFIESLINNGSSFDWAGFLSAMGYSGGAIDVALGNDLANYDFSVYGSVPGVVPLEISVLGIETNPGVPNVYSFSMGGKDFKVHGGSTANARSVQESLSRIFATPRGGELLDLLKSQGVPFHINLVSGTGSNAGMVGYSHFININLNQQDPILTTNGPTALSLTRKLAHEIGHAATGFDDYGPGGTYPDGMYNINNNENPIMLALGNDARIEY